MRMLLAILLAMLSVGNFVASVAIESLDDAVAYYDYKIQRCEIDNGKALVHSTIKKTIVGPAGDRYSFIAVSENRYAKIKELQFRVTDSDGNVVLEGKKKDLTKTCGFGSGVELYSDICNYHDEINYPKYPYSIEYECMEEIKSLFFWRDFLFQHGIPVKEAVYELICRPDFKFRVKSYGTEIQPVESIEKKWSKYRWQLTDVPALKVSDYTPDGYCEPARLSFLADSFSFGGYGFAGQSWESIGRWYFDLAEDCYLATDDDSVASPPADADQLAELRKIYYDILEGTRYVSVSIGISGWKPNEAALTQQKGYGDCKALTTLLISRLRNIGIESYPVLALTRGEDALDVDFPNFGFNHVFAVSILDGDTVWMDPTCSNCRLGELPYSDEDIPVLMVTADGGILTQSPSSEPGDNTFIKNCDVFLDSDGRISLTARLIYRGHHSHYLRIKLRHLDADELNTYIAGMLPGGQKKYEILDYSIEHIDNIDLPIEVAISAVARKRADELNNIVYLDPHIFEILDLFESLDLTDRTVPVDLGYPSLKENRLRITWDSTFSFDSVAVPPDDSADFGFFALGCHFQREDGAVLARLSREKREYMLPVDELQALEDYRASVREVTSRYIKFYKGNTPEK